jgi:hypothetical protein
VPESSDVFISLDLIGTNFSSMYKFSTQEMKKIEKEKNMRWPRTEEITSPSIEEFYGNPERWKL